MAFKDFIEGKLMPVMAAVGQQRHLVAVRDGIVMNLIPSMVGSIFLLIAALPIPGYGDWIRSIGLFDALLIPIGATLDLMGITASIAIAYRLAEGYKVDALAAGILSLLCFFLLTPYRITHELVEGGITGVLPIMYLGSRGLFTALVVAIVSAEIYVKAVKAKLTINMPEGVPPAVSKSFAALIPCALTILVFWLLRLLIDASPYENIHTVLQEFVAAPLTGIGGSLFGALLFMFLVHFLWFFGIHGHLVIGSVMDPIFYLLQDQNRLAFQAGEALPNIFTRFWFDLYVTMGGSGASLSVVLALALFARSRHLRQVGRLAALPGVFNINEPFIFGIPLVFNPILFVPWLCVPLTNVVLAWGGTITGFLPRHNGVLMPWTTPVIISGFLVSGWRSALMQIILIFIDAFIWLAFMRKLDNIEHQKELDSIK